MSRFRLTAAGLSLAALLAGCEDVPLVPRWDADWYVPLPSQAIRLNPTAVPVPVPAGSPAVTISDTSQQSLDESIGAILDRDLRAASLIVTLSKSPSLQFSAADTIIVASSQVDLGNSASTSRIVVPLVILAADASVTDTAAISQASITMLRTAAQNDGTLYIEVRARTQYQGSTTYQLQPTDTIGVKLAMLARIGVSTN